MGKGKRPKAQAKPQIVRTHSIEYTSHCNMVCALPGHKEGVESSVLRDGMCHWPIAPPWCGLLAVEHSREAPFIAASGFAVAKLPIENEVARYSSIREQSHTSQAQAQGLILCERQQLGAQALAMVTWQHGDCIYKQIVAIWRERDVAKHLYGIADHVNRPFLDL